MKKLVLNIVGSSAARAPFGWPCFRCGMKQKDCKAKIRRTGKGCCKGCDGKRGH